MRRKTRWWKKGELVKSVLVRFVGTTMCIKRFVLSWSLKETSKLHRFIKAHHYSRRGLSERSSESGIDTCNGEHVVPLDPFLLVGVGSYKRSFMCHNTVLVEVACAVWQCGMGCDFWKNGTKGKILRAISNNGVLKVHPKHSVSDTWSTRERTPRDLFFQLLAYWKLISRFCAIRNIDLRKIKAEVEQAQEKLLKQVKDRDKL